jgi:hypothetical protein
VERITGEVVTLPEGNWGKKRVKKSKPSKSWPVPKGCDKG